MTNQAPLIKRVIFRLKVTDTSETNNALDIVNHYLSQQKLPLNMNFLSPHYIHEQPQQGRVYHIILDVNHTEASSDIKIQEIHHEMYRVHLRECDPKPWVHNGQIQAQFTDLSSEFSNHLTTSIWK